MKASRRTDRRRLRGFTLVEIAIVLVIVSLLLAAGIGISVAVVDNARSRATRQNMEGVRLSLQAFIARNGRLPCPAVETLGPTNASYGIEAAPPGTCTGTVDLPGGGGIDAAKRGVLPWKTLGLTLENASDGWNNQLTYMVTVTATGKTFDTVSGMRGSLYVHSATPVAAGLPATGNQINACSTTANDNACNKAAVVVLLSHGRNIFGAYTSAGVRAPLPTDAGEIENTNDDRFVVSAEPTSTYDDIIIPLTPGDFLATLAAQGAIKNERAFMQEKARYFVALLTSDTTSCCRDGSGGPGTATYQLPSPISTAAYTFDATRFNSNCDSNPPTTVGLLPNPAPNWDAKDLRDPWGQEFRYQCANCLINSGESCLNPVVIVSPGANGALNGDPNVVAGSDDYVYYISVGELKDYFARTGW